MGNYYPVIIIILFIKTSLCFSIILSETDFKCFGYCTNDPQKCNSKGGRVTGYCTNLLACCDPMIPPATSCGSVVRGQSIVYFKSPNYPSLSSGDLNCEVKIEIQKDTIATRIDFLKAEMDGFAYAETEDVAGSCESDMIFIRGFESWAPPPRCGNLSGYSFMIDRDSSQTKSMKKLSITALMSSPAYRWHIRVVQLSRRKQPASYGKNSVDDFEIRFRTKKSLLTPTLHEMMTDGENSLSLNDTLSPSHRSIDYENSPTDPLEVPLIMYGEDSVISSVPWQVSFRIIQDQPMRANEEKNKDATANVTTNETESKENACALSEGYHFCGGSILSANFILSASHCFYGTSKSNGMLNITTLKVVVGDTNVCTDDSESSAATIPSFDYFVESITLHYAYDSQILINDIAIIKLKSPIKFFDHIKPIKLAKPGDDFTGMEALVSGWGDTEVKKKNITPTADIVSNSSALDSENSDNEEIVEDEEPVVESPKILQISKRFVIQNQTVCNEKDLEQYPSSPDIIKKHMKYNTVFDSTICTLGKVDNETGRAVSTGKGDSGGALVNFDKDGSPIIVGIVSYGVADETAGSCTNKTPKDNRTFDYFASVPFYRSYIDLVTFSFDNQV